MLRKFQLILLISGLLWGASITAQPPAETRQSEAQPQRGTDPVATPSADAQSNLPAGGKLDRTLGQFENSRLIEQLRVYLRNPYIHPRFGGTGDGSGFGLGVEFTNNIQQPSNVRLSALLQATFRSYVLARAGISIDPTGGKRERFQLDFTGRYQLRPRDNFYGVGFNSQRSNRSNYDLQERGFNFAAIWKLTPALRVGAGLDFSAARIFDGHDDRLAKTPKLFPTLPGIARGASLLSPQAFIELDKRDRPGDPTKGLFASFMASSNDSVGKDDFGFVNWRFDARGYVPLGTSRHVVAARLLGNFNETKGGSQIPFFRLARLGDSQTLRGFRPLRYYGSNALAASLEYRFTLVPRVGLVAFTDAGQVFEKRAELSAQNMRATYGGGIAFKSKNTTLVRLLVGKSAESTRVIIGFGPTF
ncbi:MAG: BamA/TamA family outer membrane protein [Blastocatellia bacterium]